MTDRELAKRIAYDFGTAWRGKSPAFMQSQVAKLEHLIAQHTAALRADLDWATLLARAAGTRDVGWSEQRGMLFIGAGHPSKDQSLACEFRDGLPVETAELRAAIEGAL